MLKTISRKFDLTPDAVSLLEADHRKVEALFGEFDAADDKRTQAALMKQICAELDVHAKIEEKVLYPKGLKVKDAHDEVAEGMVEHEGIKRLVKELSSMSPADEMFEAKAKVLKEYVKHHVREEENSMFPKLIESELDLKALGAQLQQMKERLQKREKPARSAPRRAAPRGRGAAAARGEARA